LTIYHIRYIFNTETGEMIYGEGKRR
jgi:hypothetical protein